MAKEVFARIINILPAKKQQPPKETATLERKSKRLIAQDGWCPPSFDPTGVRLVLYQDHDGRGKKQVFDSKAHLNQETNDTNVNVCAPMSPAASLTHSLRTNNNSKEDSLTSSIASSLGNSYRSKAALTRRQSSDSELLGEMMFGSMPLKLMGNSVKIHYIRSEEQLMVTKVFFAQRKMMSSCSLNSDFSESCPLPSDSASRVIEHSGTIPKLQNSYYSPLRPPSSSPDSVPRQGLTNSFLSPCHSPTASLPLSLANSGNHDFSPTQSLNLGVPSSLTSSLTRRLQRVRSTSLENGSELYHRILRPMDQSSSGRKGRKYAVGIIFSLMNMTPAERKQFHNFFFSHFNLISSSLEQLRERIEEALWCRRQLLPDIVMKAYSSFVDDFQSLYCAQRIKAPVWLEIVSGSGNRRETCFRFLSELKLLVKQLETKESKFFLSSLLTAVLSYHLAWVYTVSKSGSTTSRHHDRMTSKSLAVLAETHPYNPLWAQFGDLCGAVSNPLTVCRTIVVGKSASLVCRILYILTYFIRCSEIEEQGVFKHVMDLRLHELEESGEIFPHQQESRTGSALTLLSESGRSSGPSGLMTSNSLERVDLAPLVKPHPFSFSRGNSILSYSGSIPELNHCSMTHSCGSLDGLTTPQLSRPIAATPRLYHHHSNNMCQSVPARMLSSHMTSTQPKAPPLTPFKSHQTHGVGIVRSTQVTRSPQKDFTNSSDCSKVATSSHKRRLESQYQHEDGNCCASHSVLDSLGTCPIDTDRVVWRPGLKGSRHRPIVESPLSPPPGPPSTFTGNWYPRYSESSGGSNPAFPAALRKGSNSYPKTASRSSNQQSTMGSMGKLYGGPSVESLSTGYQTISRNPSRTSLVTSYPYATHSILPSTVRGGGAGGPPKRQGTCSSFDSGVFEHNSILTTDSERMTDRENDSLLMNSITSRGKQNLTYPQVPFNPEASLRTLPSHTNEDIFVSSTNSRHRSGAFSFSVKRPSEEVPLSSAGNPHALSHDQLHFSHLQHSSPDHTHTLPGIRDGGSTAADVFSQSYDSLTAHRVSNQCSLFRTGSVSPPDDIPETVAGTQVTHVTSKPVPFERSSYRNETRCASSPSLSSLGVGRGFTPAISVGGESLTRNSSYKGLPLLEGVCPELEDQMQPSSTCLKVEQINVEESLSAHSLSYLSTSPFNNHKMLEQPKKNGLRQFQDFSRVEIENLDDDISSDLAPLSPPPVLPSSSNNSTPHLMHFSKTPPTPSLHSQHSVSSFGGGANSGDLNDFGHSLMAGYSSNYMPHFVLHGTSQPFNDFKEHLISDLSTMIKYSIIDEPIQHGVAIVADTDSLTCRIVAVSKTKRANDGEVLIGNTRPAYSIQQLLQSVSTLWEMQLPPEFCLSSMEDGLMALNERSQMVSTGLLEQGHINDLSRSLQKLHTSLNTNASDETLLHALAGVHISSSDPNISKELQMHCLHSLVK